MDNVSKKHQNTPPLLVCPFAEFRNVEEEFRWIQFGDPPSPPALYDEFSSLFHSLPHCINRTTNCLFCRKLIDSSTFHSCKHCRSALYSFVGGDPYEFNTGYHKECLQLISKHPYHPKHYLRLQNNWLIRRPRYICSSCFSDSGGWVFRCSICDFTVCEVCARKPPVLAIDHPKRHEHTLLFFPGKGSLICDVCASIDHMSLIYSCTQCGFVVHKYCLYLPRVIRISRHEHRLSFTSSLTPEKLLCGVCRGKIDTNYGRYFCVTGCSYGVHSKCASRKDVWDGKDLEGKVEDIKPFCEISDGIIQHFSHQNHQLKLDEETNREFDGNKRCQACTLPICDDIIYSCMQCDFILHQVCAYLPQKKQHVMHPHPLSLKVFNQTDSSICRACDRIIGNGFMYACDEEEKSYFILDVRCASISEPFIYWCHPHSLFLTAKPESLQTCSIYRRLKDTCLNCGECAYVLCFGCATLLKKLRYKHDDHFLILSYDKDRNGQYWCDICEEEADLKNGIYMCNECKVTLHINCLHGEDDMHFLPRRELVNKLGRNFNIISNNCLTRNICFYCGNRCKSKVVYVTPNRKTLCYHCARR